MFLPWRHHEEREGVVSRRNRAFTLIELLVVVTIIGLMAALSMPALKGFGQGNLVNSVTRQLTDDLTYARNRAISDRCNVYVMFITSDIVTNSNVRLFLNGLSQSASVLPSVEQSRFLASSKQLWTNLVQQQYTAYAIYADRTVGDQPSQKRPRYLTEWKTLPDGVMIHPDKLTNNFTSSRWIYLKTNATPIQVENNWVQSPLTQLDFHFPSARGPELSFPCIAFNHRGELVFPYVEPGSTTPTLMNVPPEFNYEVIPLIKASGFYPTPGVPVEITPMASLDREPLMRLRIDGKTGKVSVLKNLDNDF